MNNLKWDEIDRVLLHQGSRFIVDSIAERIPVKERTPFAAAHYGNTVSSSIPLMLASGICDADRRILVAGFGVGLSWAATALILGTDMSTETHIRKILSQVVKSDAPYKWDADYVFIDDALDSLDHAAFLLAIQDQLGIVVHDKDMMLLNSIANTLAYLRSKSVQG